MACVHQGAEIQTVAPCSGVDSQPAPWPTSSTLAGSFGLTLVATSGTRSGSRVHGTLTLSAAPQSIRARESGGTLYPFVGSAAVVLDSVGAVAPGSPESSDAEQPGVLGLETPSTAGKPAREILLRFGSEANGAGAPRFDGSFMVLNLRSMASDRFTGLWNSGVNTRRSSGYFCADRSIRR